MPVRWNAFHGTPWVIEHADEIQWVRTSKPVMIKTPLDIKFEFNWKSGLAQGSQWCLKLALEMGCLIFKQTPLKIQNLHFFLSEPFENLNLFSQFLLSTFEKNLKDWNCVSLEDKNIQSHFGKTCHPQRGREYGERVEKEVGTSRWNVTL